MKFACIFSIHYLRICFRIKSNKIVFTSNEKRHDHGRYYSDNCEERNKVNLKKLVLIFFVNILVNSASISQIKNCFNWNLRLVFMSYMLNFEKNVIYNNRSISTCCLAHFCLIIYSNNFFVFFLFLCVKDVHLSFVLSVLMYNIHNQFMEFT